MLEEGRGAGGVAGLLTDDEFALLPAVDRGAVEVPDVVPDDELVLLLEVDRGAVDVPELLEGDELVLLLEDDRGDDEVPVLLPDDLLLVFGEVVREVDEVRLDCSSSAVTAEVTNTPSAVAASRVIRLSFRMELAPKQATESAGLFRDYRMAVCESSKSL